MSFEFHVDSENKIVRLVFDETTSSEERIKALDEIVEIAVKNPSLNLILDVSQYEDYLSDDEKLNFGESLASKKEYFKNSKTAVITKKGRRGYSLILVVSKIFRTFFWRRPQAVCFISSFCLYKGSILR